MSPKNIREWIGRIDENLPTLDEEYDRAFYGVVCGRDGKQRAVYDFATLVDILNEKGKDYEQAVEFIEYELFGYWLNDGPMLLHRI